MRKFSIISVLLLLVTWMACRKNDKTQAAVVKDYYTGRVAQADSQVRALRDAVLRNAPAATLQDMFRKARLAYKRTEFLAEYYTPLTAKYINGAPIPSMDENDQHRIQQPEGFQVVEPFLFPVYDARSRPALLQQLNTLLANFTRLKNMARLQELADAQVFDALRNEVFRIITTGISGFDAPLAQNSVPEAREALAAVKDVLELYHERLHKADAALPGQTAALLDSASAYLAAHAGFNSFNRMEFITRYANPLSALIVKASSGMKLEKITGSRPLRAGAASLFEKGAFNADYYAAGANAGSTAMKTALGKRLFFDPVLSGNGKRSCASCHQPDKAFTDGLVKNTSIDGSSTIRRNTPTLLNAGLQSALFYDNRVAYLEDQATEVINNTTEMHGSLPRAVNRLQQDASYLRLFKSAFPGLKEPVNEYNLRNALGSYIRSLSSLNSPFDRYVRGDRSQLSAAEINGFNLFMGKGKCGTCHFAPLFNGNVPPDFLVTETEVIGVPLNAKVNKIDTDQGRYDLRRLPLYRYAFRTPGLRNIALTAPYMHNGVYQSLEEVIDFYNKGGGAGLGIKLENQTLPFDKLNLTAAEKKNIIAFLNKLTDTAAIRR